MKKTIFYVFTLLIVAMFSCRKGTPSWETDVTVPLIQFSLGVDQIIPDSLMQTNSSNAITIVYDKKLYELSVDSLVNFPDTASTLYFYSPVSGMLQPGQVLVNSTDYKRFSFGSALLSQIKIKKGSIKVEFKNTINEKVDISYSFPTANLNGVPFSIHEILPSHIENPNTIYKTYDISGYTFDLTGINHNLINTLPIQGIIKVADNAQPVNVNTFDAVVMTSMFNNIEIGYAKGYFGSSNFEIGPETSYLGLFNKIISGSIHFHDISMKLFVHNGLGVDARATIKSFWCTHNLNGQTINLASSIINQPQNISRALETFNPAHPVQATDYTYDLSNSNVAALLENFPDIIGYHLIINSNPLGDVSAGNDFYYDGNGFNASFQVEIPLSIIAHDLLIADTTSFTISMENVNSGTFYLYASNGFPLGANLQLKLFDANNIQIHTLMSNQEVLPGLLDNNGKVTEKTKTTISIPLNEFDILKLKNTKHISIFAKFNTVDQQHPVNIYKDYKMDVTLSGNFNYNISIR
ncbi:MAG: hypothetical protein WCH34_08805 [Bacteroidota bacterium]